MKNPPTVRSSFQARFAPTLGRVALSVIGLGACISATGCNNAGEGALSGAALGAGAGAIIGSFTGSAGLGAGIGAITGAVGGGVVGDQNDRRSRGY